MDARVMKQPSATGQLLALHQARGTGCHGLIQYGNKGDKDSTLRDTPFCS